MMPSIKSPLKISPGSALARLNSRPAREPALSGGLTECARMKFNGSLMNRLSMSVITPGGTGRRLGPGRGGTGGASTVTHFPDDVFLYPLMAPTPKNETDNVRN